MIDERKALKHSKERCYIGVIVGIVVSLIQWDVMPTFIGALFSMAAIAGHFDLKRLIKNELKRQIN